MDEKKITLLVLIDMSKAFDSINHDMLFLKLRSLGVSPSALEWFNSFLKGRYQHVRIGDAISQSLPIDHGVPQGSIHGVPQGSIHGVPQGSIHGVPQGSILGPVLFGLYQIN